MIIQPKELNNLTSGMLDTQNYSSHKYSTYQPETCGYQIQEQAST